MFGLPFDSPWGALVLLMSQLSGLWSRGLGRPRGVSDWVVWIWEGTIPPTFWESDWQDPLKGDLPALLFRLPAAPSSRLLVFLPWGGLTESRTDWIVWLWDGDHLPNCPKPDWHIPLMGEPLVPSSLLLATPLYWDSAPGRIWDRVLWCIYIIEHHSAV